MAATTQIVAALVRPTTAPRACKIVPAPMNPTPVTICAAARVGARLGGAGPEQVRHLARLRLQPLGPLADGGERGYHIVRQHPLAVETTPSCGAAVVRHQLERVRRREALVNGEDVADVGVARVLPRDARRVGGRGLELFPDGLRRVEEGDRVAKALRHLGLAVEPEDALRRREQGLRLGQRESVREPRVPAAGDLAHQLEVLELVFAHRHECRFVQEHVGRLEHGIVQEPRRHALLALRLVLELRLTLELAQWRDGVQDPVELRVLGDVRLHEDDGPRRIDAGGEEPDRHVDRALGQGRCVVGLRDGMQVHDAEQAVVLVLQLDPVLHGAEVIADVQLAGRLDAGKDARHGLTTYDGGGRRRKVRELKDLVDVARRAAERAARFLRGTTPASNRDWIEKGRHDFVTEADRQAEALIADTLLHAVPESRVVGEELSPAAAREGDVVWIVDPLDGTTNFLHGYPQYAVSIGALVGGVLSVGVVHDVPRDRAYWGASGLGAWEGERSLQVSRLAEPRQALVGTGFPFKSLPLLRPYLDQSPAASGASSVIRPAGPATLDLTDVAAGRPACFLEVTPAPRGGAAPGGLVRATRGRRGAPPRLPP